MREIDIGTHVRSRYGLFRHFTLVVVDKTPDGRWKVGISHPEYLKKNAFRYTYFWPDELQSCDTSDK
jgi:hypothetical protein